LRTSKNGWPRLLPLVGELADLIERRWAKREHRPPDERRVRARVPPGGRPVKDFREAWNEACKAAKAPGVLFHDLRRSGVRDMVNAGVPQSMAMAIRGHRTASMFNRYAIVSPDDMRAALGRTQEYRAAMKGENNVTDFPSEGAGRWNRHRTATIRAQSGPKSLQRVASTERLLAVPHRVTLVPGLGLEPR